MAVKAEQREWGRSALIVHAFGNIGNCLVFCHRLLTAHGQIGSRYENKRIYSKS